MVSLLWTYWGMLIAVLLPYVCAVLAKSGGCDNAAPRASLQKLTGWRARAHAAQANGFEALPFFLAAVLLALHLDANVPMLNAWILAFLILRMVYIVFYLGNQAKLRSLVWSLAIVCNIVIFWLGIH